jgi:hypothetical protein
MIFLGVSKHPNKTHADAIAVVDEFKHCLKSDEEANSLEQVDIQVSPCWKTPPKDTITINFDAAINKKTGFMGMGVIAKDCMGNLLGAK